MSVNKKARVALESAVVTHGLPRPFNLEVARACEAAVRKTGASPLTVGVLEGNVRVGLSAKELEKLALDTEAEKCAVQDIGRLAATGGSGGATVSATLALAARARIAVMCTGGIGGVHRSAARERRWDVSADLLQLTRSPVIVVCAGAKCVLDLPRTLEALDTLGVPVVGFQTMEFPGFFYSETGLVLRHWCSSIRELAAAMKAYRKSGYAGAILVVQPPPEELDPVKTELLIRAALEESHRLKISGPGVTPFLLSALAEASDGRTLEINRKLLLACAETAGKLAMALR
jgi:pseudouridine-5'-phosphate glycosidase